MVPRGLTTNIAGTTQSLIAGQLAALDSVILNSCNQPATRYSWYVPGNIASSWTPDRNASGQPSSPALDQQGVTFAWTTGGSGKIAQIDVTFADGSTARAAATFNITIPTADAHMIPSDVSLDRMSVGFPGRQALYYSINFSVGIPLTPSGDIEWVQIVNSVITRRSAAGQETQRLVGLDTYYPYNSVPNDNGASDQPSFLLQTGYDQVTRSDYLTMVLMYRPTAPSFGAAGGLNLWVPVSGYNWNWSAAAQSADGGVNWSMEGTPTSDPRRPPYSTPMATWTSYPSWTANADDQRGIWVKQ
jgi:hypothetical protein